MCWIRRSRTRISGSAHHARHDSQTRLTGGQVAEQTFPWIRSLSPGSLQGLIERLSIVVWIGGIVPSELNLRRFRTMICVNAIVIDLRSTRGEFAGCDPFIRRK